MARVELTDAPSMRALFARAAVTARGRGGELPDTRLARTGVPVDPAELAAYDRVCGFPLADTLPATYPHVLTFPLQVALMSDRSFPLALPGLVHVRNRVDVLRAVRTDEVLDLEVWAERFARHPRGATVDLCASVSAGGGARAGRPSRPPRRCGPRSGWSSAGPVRGSRSARGCGTAGCPTAGGGCASLPTPRGSCAATPGRRSPTTCRRGRRRSAECATSRHGTARPPATRR